MPCWGSNHISHEQGTCSNYYNLSRALQAIFFLKYLLRSCCVQSLFLVLHSAIITRLEDHVEGQESNSGKMCAREIFYLLAALYLNTKQQFLY